MLGKLIDARQYVARQRLGRLAADVPKRRTREYLDDARVGRSTPQWHLGSHEWRDRRHEDAVRLRRRGLRRVSPFRPDRLRLPARPSGTTKKSSSRRTSCCSASTPGRLHVAQGRVREERHDETHHPVPVVRRPGAGGCARYSRPFLPGTTEGRSARPSVLCIDLSPPLPLALKDSGGARCGRRVVDPHDLSSPVSQPCVCLFRHIRLAPRRTQLRGLLGTPWRLRSGGIVWRRALRRVSRTITFARRSGPWPRRDAHEVQVHPGLLSAGWERLAAPWAAEPLRRRRCRSSRPARSNPFRRGWSSLCCRYTTGL